jgi:hypothetical protein
MFFHRHFHGPRDADGGTRGRKGQIYFDNRSGMRFVWHSTGPGRAGCAKPGQPQNSASRRPLWSEKFGMARGAGALFAAVFDRNPN